MYSFVSSHFDKFLKDLELDATDRRVAEGRAERIAKSLFAKYWPNQVFDPACYIIVGSYGKGLATKPRSDLDILFVLPAEVYFRVETRFGNKQSALLQEVKQTLCGTFPITDLSADGQVIVAPFLTYNVDVVPAFRLVSGPNTGSYVTAHTADGGSWRLSNPAAEYNWLKSVDAVSAGKASDLVKMLKAWKRECNVELKSICLEVAAGVFVQQWANRGNGIGYGYHDWMVRDFFAFLLNYVNGTAKTAGVNEWIPLGDAWQSKCQTAYNRAAKACSYEHQDAAYNASSEWRKIFGSQFQTDWSSPLGLSLMTGQRA